MNFVKEITSVDYHRNGISGAPFRIVRFINTENDQRMIAFVFDEPGHVAVVNEDKMKDGETRFFHNSFRGDRFEPDLRHAMNEWEEKQRLANVKLEDIIVTAPPGSTPPKRSCIS